MSTSTEIQFLKSVNPELASPPTEEQVQPGFGLIGGMKYSEKLETVLSRCQSLLVGEKFYVEEIHQFQPHLLYDDIQIANALVPWTEISDVVRSCDNCLNRLLSCQSFEDFQNWKATLNSFKVKNIDALVSYCFPEDSGNPKRFGNYAERILQIISFLNQSVDTLVTNKDNELDENNLARLRIKTHLNDIFNRLLEDKDAVKALKWRTKEDRGVHDFSPADIQQATISYIIITVDFTMRFCKEFFKNNQKMMADIEQDTDPIWQVHEFVHDEEIQKMVNIFLVRWFNHLITEYENSIASPVTVPESGNAGSNLGLEFTQSGNDSISVLTTVPNAPNQLKLSFGLPGYDYEIHNNGGEPYLLYTKIQSKTGSPPAKKQRIV